MPLGAAVLLVGSCALYEPAFLMAAPAVLLVATLVVGWFPGAEVLERLRVRRTHRRRRRGAAPRLRVLGATRPGSAARGGVLLGLHLAGNGPPRPASAA